MPTNSASPSRSGGVSCHLVRPAVLLLALGGLAVPASADVFVNRVLLPPTQTDPCPYQIQILPVSSATWDQNFQNAWGNCVGLPMGPPFAVERHVRVNGSLTVLDGLLDVPSWPIEVQPGGVLTIENAGVSLGASITVADGGSLTLRNASVALLNSLSTISLFENTTLVVEGTSFNAPFGRALNVQGNTTSVSLSACTFDVSGPGGQIPALSVSSNTGANSLSIDGCMFSYTGTGQHGFVWVTGGSVDIRNTSFDGANGTPLRLGGVTSATLVDNDFLGTICVGPTFVGCGFPLVFLNSRIQLLQGNTGAGNLFDGMLFVGGGHVGPTLTGAWSTTPDFPLVVRTVLLILPGETLNLAPGTVLKFGPEGGNMIVNGTLHATGVTFTAFDDNSVGGNTGGSGTPEPGAWRGLEVEGQTNAAGGAEAFLDGCTFRYSGNSGPTLRRGHRARLELVNSTLTYGASNGVYLINQAGAGFSDVEAVLAGNTISDHGGIGIWVVDIADPNLGAPPTHVEANTVYGNSRGIDIETANGAAPVIVRNRIVGNEDVGLAWSGRNAVFVANNVIAANGSHGLVESNAAVGPPDGRLLNNTVYGNGGDGLRLLTSGTPNVNNLLAENVGYGMWEGANTDSPPRHSDLFGNGAGLFFDGASGLTLAQVNGLPGAAGNLDADPLFAVAAQGTSTGITVDAAAGISTLTDTNGGFTPSALEGLTLNPDTGQQRHFYIVSNTATALTVLGDLTTVASVGAAYRVTDLVPIPPASPIIDAGENRADLPAIDFAGNTRVQDGGAGLVVDIGAYEFGGFSTSSSDNGEAIQTPYRLSAAYPNPFTDFTRFTLAVQETQHVAVRVFDVLGRAVVWLHNGPLVAGQDHSFVFDGRGYASGMYVYEVNGERFQARGSITLVR